MTAEKAKKWMRVELPKEINVLVANLLKLTDRNEGDLSICFESLQ
jgi:hypothetical protein